MKALDPQILFTANSLIHEHGSKAEEHVTSKLWQSRQAGDEIGIAKWTQLLLAIREVRSLRSQI
jgi:hypothetical protein